jgi:uncharacterized protein YbcI
VERDPVLGDTDEQRPQGGEALAAISNGVVRMMRDATGKGPTKCKTHWAGSDTLVVVLGGGYLDAEKTLYAAGRAEDVRQSRQAIQAVLEGPLRALVEETVGRPVIAFMSTQHQDPDLQVEIFVLEPSGASDHIA